MLYVFTLRLEIKLILSYLILQTAVTADLTRRPIASARHSGILTQLQVISLHMCSNYAVRIAHKPF